VRRRWLRATAPGVWFWNMNQPAPHLPPGSYHSLHNFAGDRQTDHTRRRWHCACACNCICACMCADFSSGTMRRAIWTALAASEHCVNLTCDNVRWHSTLAHLIQHCKSQFSVGNIMHGRHCDIGWQWPVFEHARIPWHQLVVFALMSISYADVKNTELKWNEYSSNTQTWRHSQTVRRWISRSRSGDGPGRLASSSFSVSTVQACR